jgi:F0F1-type ATP synthase assembly protein I
MNKPKKNKPLHKYARFSGIAFQMAVTIFIGTFIGVKLDEKYPNENNLFTVIFSLLFVMASLYLVVKQVTNYSKNKEE